MKKPFQKKKIFFTPFILVCFLVFVHQEVSAQVSEEDLVRYFLEKTQPGDDLTIKTRLNWLNKEAQEPLGIQFIVTDTQDEVVFSGSQEDLSLIHI